MIAKIAKALNSAVCYLHTFLGKKMQTKKLLIDTGVWISYFGDRGYSESERKSIELAQQIIPYCWKSKELELCYTPYIEKELANGTNADRSNNIANMRKNSTRLNDYVGNDTWDEIDSKWEDIGSLWNNEAEAQIAKSLHEKLPDGKKPNRVDRKILLAAIQDDVSIIIHENPKDFSRDDVREFASSNNVLTIDLTEVNTLDEFKKLLE